MSKILRANMSTSSLVTEEQWERAFDQADGFTQVDDRLPEHFTEIPNPAAEKAIFDVPEEELADAHQMSGGRSKA